MYKKTITFFCLRTNDTQAIVNNAERATCIYVWFITWTLDSITICIQWIWYSFWLLYEPNSTISEATIWQSPPVRFELHQPLILFRNIRCVCVCFYFGASTIALIPNWLDNNNKSTKYCCLKIKTDQITINFQILLLEIFYRQNSK